MYAITFNEDVASITDCINAKVLKEQKESKNSILICSIFTFVSIAFIATIMSLFNLGVWSLIYLVTYASCCTLITVSAYYRLKRSNWIDEEQRYLNSVTPSDFYNYPELIVILNHINLTPY